MHGQLGRSIIAEALLNHLGHGRFRAYSAGSHPSGSVNPIVIDYLGEHGVPAAGARSKPWEEFAGPDAPRMDLVITVCDEAAGEACPVWPGTPAAAHWSAPDPAAFMHDPEAARSVVRTVFLLMKRRIDLLLSLPVDKLDRLSLQRETRAIADRTASSRDR